jgi:signal transduction histidine kinase
VIARLTSLARFAPLALLVWLAAGAGLAGSTGEPVLRDLAELEDPTGAWTADDVARSDAFRPVAAEGLAHGYTHSAWWLRFTVDAPAGEWWLDLLPAFLDDVRLYAPGPGGGFVEHRTGDALPFSSREVDYRGFLFKLQHADAQPRTYLLRIRTSSTLAALPRVIAPDRFFPRAAWEQALFAMIPAVLLAIVMLKAALWMHVRDRLALWFLGYIICLHTSVGAAAGLWSMYVTPEWPAVNHYATGLSTIAALALGHAFYRRLFGLTRADGWPYWLYEGATWTTAAAAVAFALTGDNVAVTGRLLATLPLMNAVGVWMAARAWRRGAPGGAPMLVANVMTMASIGAYSLLMQGLVWNQAVFLYALPASALGSMLALDLALAARLGALDTERRQALVEVARGTRERDQQARFIDLVSHEYRTPLAVLQTNLDILALSTDEDERRISADRMRLAVTRLRDLFTGAQRVSLELADHRHVQVTTLDAAAVLCEAVTEMDGVYPDSRYALALGSGPAPVRADPTLLRTVLRNLLENAAKYGVAGSPVDVHLTRDDARITVVVGNDCARGPGLSPEALLRGYARGANAIGKPGLGMGLHLAQRIAEEMGASLRVELPSARRFEVRIEFPAAQEAAA